MDLPKIMNMHETLVRKTKLTINTDQEVILITRDRIDLTLRDNVPKLADLGALLSKAGIFLALLLGVVTTESKDIGGIQKETWDAVFLIATVLSLAWLIIGLVKYLRRKKISDIVDALVKASEK